MVGASRAKLAVVVLVTAVLAVLVGTQVDGINGPAYWQWPWRRAVHGGVTPYLILLLAACPTFIAVLRFSGTGGAGSVLAVLLMMGSAAGIEASNRGLDLMPFDLTRVATIIEEAGSNGYFTQAQEFVASGESLRQYLGEYAARMHGFSLHVRNKPPGSVLFYVPFVKGAPNENAAAMAAGFAIALLATLSVPAAYALVVELTGDRTAAFYAAACMSLTPGVVLFLPEFDQFYPAYSCALMILWAAALRTGRPGFALAFGVLFAFVCFQTFNFLVLGVFVVGMIWMKGSKGWLVAVRQAAVVLATFLIVYGLLWLWCGYSPLRTLVVGIANHQEDMPATHRVWPGTILFDLTDFALGLGWVSVLLAIFYLVGEARKDGRLGIILLCLAQPVAVALSGQIQGETARVWVFMMPLVLVPAGLELAGWGRYPRLAALGCLWLLMAVLSQKMVFV